MNHKGAPNFTAYSAGSHPTGSVRAEALSQLEASHLPTAGLRSKSWNEFARKGAPSMNFVFTVCDNAANEVCPVYGELGALHYHSRSGCRKGTEEQVRKAFREAFFLLDRRISLLVNLPLSTMGRPALKKRTRRHRPLLISNRAPVCWRHCIP